MVRSNRCCRLNDTPNAIWVGPTDDFVHVWHIHNIYSSAHRSTISWWAVVCGVLHGINDVSFVRGSNRMIGRICVLSRLPSSLTGQQEPRTLQTTTQLIGSSASLVWIRPLCCTQVMSGW